MIRHARFLTLVATMVVAGGAFAVEPEYKEYTPVASRSVYFQISYDDRSIGIGRSRDSSKIFMQFDRKSQRMYQDSVTLMMGDGSGTQTVFGRDGLEFDGTLLRYDFISDLAIDYSDGLTIITCYTRRSADSSLIARRGNRISFDDRVLIGEGSFVRGVIFTVKGNVSIEGEINRDVVSLFGDINVGPAAVVRGSLASISGIIDAARDASIYGDVYSGAKKGAPRKHRFVHRDRAVEMTGRFRYDRVDGAAPYGGLKFTDGDSLLPTVSAEFGYGFASKRWRYQVALEQVVWRRIPTALGGSFGRQLVSGDDWLVSNDENLVYTLLAQEDLKDYYETEGGSLYVKTRPVKDLTFELRYANQDMRWLDAHRHLWSMFGGDKIFRENFSTVDEPYRTAGIAAIDSGTSASLNFRLDYDTRNPERLFERSAWAATAELRWSSPDFNSSFDYRRYQISLRRYQKVNRYTMLLGRAMVGGSDGYLPMYDRFFLGGLGTLHGYYQKELMGTRFWLANAEYRVGFPHSDFAFSVLWDVGQIANDHRLNGDVEVKNSLGAAMYIGDDFRVSLAKRLDRSDRDNPKFYVRLEHTF